jgi:hypothetical protein
MGIINKSFSYKLRKLHVEKIKTLHSGEFELININIFYVQGKTFDDRYLYSKIDLLLLKNDQFLKAVQPIKIH